MEKESNKYDIQTLAADVFRKVREQQLTDFHRRMPDGKKGVEVEIGGRKFVAAIRRLTPQECAKLQTVPENYEFVSSETQQYRGLGNGWNIETIKHCFSFLPERLKRKPLTVLSLFDGISGGQMALRGLGLNVKRYIASEIDRHAIANTQHNYPETIQIGSVVDIDVDELVRKYGVPNLLIGGSPCQSFSFSGKMKGMSTKQGEEIYTLDKYLQMKREGFEFEGQSYLFWEYMRVLTELRRYNPDIIFFLENVQMLEKWERCLSHAIGVRGVHIDSALVSAQHRRRIYWSNIRTKVVSQTFLFADEDNPFAWPSLETDIPQPEDRGIFIKDILEDEADGRYYLKDELTRRLLERTDKAKLHDYLIEPQVSEEEALAYMNAHADYADFTSEQKAHISRIGFKLEQERLKKVLANEKE